MHVLTNCPSFLLDKTLLLLYTRNRQAKTSLNGACDSLLTRKEKHDAITILMKGVCLESYEQ